VCSQRFEVAYKEKICPKCGVKHNKRGEFCSRTCGNQKKHTESAKRKISKGKSAWLLSGTDEAEAEKHNFISKGINKTPEPVPPVVHKSIGENQFIAGGDLWTEVD
jgi:hypothetical protein